MNWIIIVAGGRGERMDLGFNKIFAKLGRLPLLYWTLLAFEKSKYVDRIIISANEAEVEKVRKLVKKFRFKKVIDIVRASGSRQASTFDILHLYRSKMKKSDLVGVHNAVNLFVSESEIRQVFAAAKRFGAALLAQPARDTVKVAGGEGLVAQTPPRQNVWYAQTPQVSTFGNLWKAFVRAKSDNFIGTDDSQLLERVGIRPKIVACSNKNFKITFREDLELAKHILKNG